MTDPDAIDVELGAGVGAAFLSRIGGHSSAPYDGLNLGLHVGDDPSAVIVNRVRAAAALGLVADRTTWAEQVHGARVAIVSGGDVGRGVFDVGDAVAGADALVTSEVDAPLAVLVADCLPILLATADGSRVAAVHAGRRGLLAGVIEATAADLTAAGAGFRAVVGPHIGPCCYEVGADVHADAVARMPVLDARTADGRLALDLLAGATESLTAAGATSVDHVGGCTSCDADRWFSYRRDGRTGRFAGMVWRS